MLDTGDKAPRFKLAADDGSQFDLAAYKGTQVVVYFYPRDDTPGCTVEATEFSKQVTALKRLGAIVVGVSKDSVASHCRFRDKHRLKILLLSDPDLSVHKAFGAWGEKTMYGKKVEGVIRSTFLIGPDGWVSHVWPRVKVAGHVDAVLAALRSYLLRAPAADKPTAKTPTAKKPAAKYGSGQSPRSGRSPRTSTERSEVKPAAKKPAAR